MDVGHLAVDQLRRERPSTPVEALKKVVDLVRPRMAPPRSSDGATDGQGREAWKHRIVAEEEAQPRKLPLNSIQVSP